MIPFFKFVFCNFAGFFCSRHAKGADVDLTGGEYGSALQAASSRGHEDIVQILLAKDVDVNFTGGNYVSVSLR